MNKEHILAEVRRLVSQNGGTPPGRRQFFSETGIRESAWSNKAWNNWNNWGDVLEEAGFSRLNSKGKMGHSQILRELALLTRKLGRFPVTLDMRREKRSNPGFPNDKVASAVFGGRENLPSALAQFCSRENEFEDLLPILKKTTISAGFKAKVNRNTDAENGANTSRSGYVYLFQSRKLYKVGCSRAPYRRLSELITQSAFGGKPIHIITTDDPEGIEQYWHKRFESSRVVPSNKASGEWFLLSAGDVAAFKRRKTM